MSRILIGLFGMAVLLLLYSTSPSMAWAAMVAVAYNVGKHKHKASRVPQLACEG